MKRNDFKCPKSSQKSRDLVTYLLTYLPIYLPTYLSTGFEPSPISNVTFESLKRQSQTLLLSCNTFIYLIAAATTLPSFQQGFLFLFLPSPPVLWHQKVVKFYAKNWKNLSNSSIEKKDPNIFMEKITKFFRGKKTPISSSNQRFYFYFFNCVILPHSLAYQERFSIKWQLVFRPYLNSKRTS